MKDIIEGVRRFRTQVYPQKRQLFEALARGQRPSAVIICCADSRVDMQLVTQCDPGHLFCFRNAGNIVPPYGTVLGAVSATIEYAMVALEIPNIIVCGHSDCGAMRGVLSQGLEAKMPTVAQWLRFSDAAHQIVLRDDQAPEDRLSRLIELNVLAQLEHLKTHPSVAVRLAHGEVQLHGWVYDIEHGTVTAYDRAAGRFVPLEHEPEAQAAEISALAREARA